MLTGLRRAGSARFLDVSCHLLGEVAGEDRYTDCANEGRGRTPEPFTYISNRAPKRMTNIHVALSQLILRFNILILKRRTRRKVQETLGHASLATTSIYVSYVQLAKKAQTTALQVHAL
jgi:hypothetical protein